jgi:putative tricarboxylic transport membrane protein
MMTGLEGLLGGFGNALAPDLLLWALWGCLLGNLVGVLPGLGSAGAIAILLPVTTVLPPGPAIIMLGGIYYGSQYGGTITTILLNIPGEASSAVTALDGHPMARQGRAGAALGIAAIGSFVGGCIGTLALAFGAPILARAGLAMGPAERFSMMLFALALLGTLLGKDAIKGFMMAFLGLLISTVGIDPTEGVPRFTFGEAHLLDGVNFAVAVMGLFGLAEVLLNAEERLTGGITEKVGRIVPTLAELRQALGAIVRGSIIGTGLGIIPGAGSTLASFISYGAETSVARDSSRFGRGAIEGVAGPETANNAYANASFIPLFSLGIPGTGSLAIQMGGMMMYGITPGPFLFRDNPSLVWTVIGSMLVGNIILLALNIPLVSIWIQLLRIRYSLLSPLIAILTLVGAYSITSSVFAVWIAIAFGAVGYVCHKLRLPLPPLVFTMVVGPSLESSFRRALQISNGDPSYFLSSWISIVFLGAAALLVLFVLATFLLRRQPMRSLATPD